MFYNFLDPDKFLDSDNPQFPDILSLKRREGPIAFGGNLEPETLIKAYRKGIFPWYTSRMPKTWWAPFDRMVLIPKEIHISKSMRSVLRNRGWVIRYDECFGEVIKHCSNVRRKGPPGTWLHEEMINAYLRLHEMGLAHSVEVWKDNELIGGLYGVYISGVFSGESMFSLVPNSSKAALIALARLCQERGCHFIDCQIYNPHLERMGARLIPGFIIRYLWWEDQDSQDFWPKIEERPAYSLL